jgi:hypothetical protein
MAALMCASRYGHADTVRVLVELGASLEAVDKVNIHAHALACTCCIKAVSGIMRMTIILMSHACACIFVCMYIYMFIYMFISIYLSIYLSIYIYIYNICVCEREKGASPEAVDKVVDE